MKKFTHKEYDELGEYVDLEGNEIADYLIKLMKLWEVPEDYGKSNNMSKAIDLDLWHWLKRFRSESKIIYTEVCRDPIIRKELEWL